jgi:hypothetical protein
MAMRIAVASAKGSPGATCFALALAVVWSRPVVLVEADPAGGDLGGRFGVPDHPGLASLVVSARHNGGPGLWHTHAQHVPVGADVVIAPASARQAHAAVAGLAAHLPDAQVDLVFDVGRLAETSPAWPLAGACDELLLISATDVASIDHTAALTSQHCERPRLSVVLVGDIRFPLAEVTDVLGVPILATVPTDVGTAAVLTGAARPGRHWSRFGVPAAARTAARPLAPGPAAVAPAAVQQPRRRSTRLRVPAFTRGEPR